MPFNPLDAYNQLTYINNNRRSRRLAFLTQADGASFVFKLIIFTLMLSSACGQAPTPHRPSLEATSTVLVSITPQLNQTSEAMASPTPIETQAMLSTGESHDCDNRIGTTLSIEIDSSISTQPIAFRIYLPPCYAEDSDQNYPALYMLHGIQSDDSQWVDLGITDIANNLISSGQVEPFIIIMPWQKTGLDIENALIEDLVPHIDEIYRTRSQPFWRAIGGLSRGGGSALRIGLKHPDVFGVIGLHSPATFYDIVYVSLWIREISIEDMPRIWIDIGDQDSLRDATLELIALLDELEVPYTSLLPEGDHSPAYWSAHLEDYLLWYALPW